MKIYFSLLLLLLPILLVNPRALGSPISMPLDHWSYHFVERFQAKGALRGALSNIRPYSRDEMADMIIHISALAENGEISLSKIEKGQLRILERELAQEMTERERTGIADYDHLLNWSDGEKSLVIEFGFEQTATSKRGSEDYRNYRSESQVVIRGDLGDDLFFYSDTRVIYKDREEPRPIWDPYRSTGRDPFEAISDSYLVFPLSWTELLVGKDALLWGPGYHGVLGLSGVDPTFYMVRLPIRIWKVKFSGIAGFLRDDLGRQYKSDLVRKYLAGHRVEINPLPGLCIGWQEVYIYAENFRPELLNPIMPYQMAEDYLGDIGNNTMEGDIDFCILPNTRLYASVFLDDFHLKSLFTYPANRWAILGGAFIVDPFGIQNFDLRVEYARVEPWTYTHRGVVQDPPIPTAYKHFNTPLGHWIGPNADDLFLEVNHRLSGDLLTTLSYGRVREGEIGGNIHNYSHAAMGREKRFLMGIVEKTRTVGWGLTYWISHDSTVEVNYSHTRVHNKQAEEAKLPDTHERKQAWEVGRDWMQNIVQVVVRLKY